MAHIIYAEDDELMAELVRVILQKEGHIVGLVGDGISALRAISAKHPDLVILDCNMPGLSGINVLSSMRVDSGLYEIPVLMLTSRSSEKDISLAKFAGANEYMKKPFDPHHLAFTVDTMLAKKDFPALSSVESPRAMSL